MCSYLILSESKRHLPSITSDFDPYFTELRECLRDSMLELVVSVTLRKAIIVSSILCYSKEDLTWRQRRKLVAAGLLAQCYW